MNFITKARFWLSKVIAPKSYPGKIVAYVYDLGNDKAMIFHPQDITIVREPVEEGT